MNGCGRNGRSCKGISRLLMDLGNGVGILQLVAVVLLVHGPVDILMSEELEDQREVIGV